MGWDCKFCSLCSFRAVCLAHFCCGGVMLLETILIKNDILWVSRVVDEAVSTLATFQIRSQAFSRFLGINRMRKPHRNNRSLCNEMSRLWDSRRCSKQAKRDLNHQLVNCQKTETAKLIRSHLALSRPRFIVMIYLIIVQHFSVTHCKLFVSLWGGCDFRMREKAN